MIKVFFRYLDSQREAERLGNFKFREQKPIKTFSSCQLFEQMPQKLPISDRNCVNVVGIQKRWIFLVFEILRIKINFQQISIHAKTDKTKKGHLKFFCFFFHLF